MTNDNWRYVCRNIHVSEAERIMRALRTLGDANLREARSRKFAGKANAEARAILREDAMTAFRDADRWYRLIIG